MDFFGRKKVKRIFTEEVEDVGDFVDDWFWVLKVIIKKGIEYEKEWELGFDKVMYEV